MSKKSRKQKYAAAKAESDRLIQQAVSDAQKVSDGARPLATLVEIANSGKLSDPDMAEWLLLLQCMEALSTSYALSLPAATERFRVYATERDEPWWPLYQQAMEQQEPMLSAMRRVSKSEILGVIA